MPSGAEVRRSTGALDRSDPEIAALIRREQRRQAEGIELIASENYCSRAVREACGSILTNKYVEGYAGRRYYHGCEQIDAIERLAIDRARRLFGVDHVNVQPHSGSGANAAVYQGVLRPGDTILGWDLYQGGHFTHGSPENSSGRFYRSVQYSPSVATERLDFDQIRRLAKRERPRIIAVGASAYPRTLDFARFREIADEVGAWLLTDIAHIAGLVVAGLHPSPAGLADFVTTTTHKTLRGPRGGMIMTRSEHAQRVDAGVFPGTQGGALAHVIAAKAIAFKEALEPSFRAYQAQVLANAGALANALLQAGLELLTGGTDNHLMLVKTAPLGFSGREAADRLSRVGITCNKNMIPGDPRPPSETSAIRLGTPAVTTRGLDAADCAELGALIARTLRGRGSDLGLRAIEREVREIGRRRPMPEGICGR